MYSQDVQRSFFKTCSTPVLTYEPKPARYGSHGESKRNNSTPLLLFALDGRKKVTNLNELCSKCYKGFTAESSGHTIGTIRLFMQPSNANNFLTSTKYHAPHITSPTRHTAQYLKVEMNDHKFLPYNHMSQLI